MPGGYPWAQGDLLLANDLNAAINAASSAAAAGGPFLPGVVVPAGGSIQAAHDGLPATGGEITLLANTTYVQTTTLNISKPNVTIQAPSWNTVIQRGAGLTPGHLIEATTTATGFVLRGVTVDGNSVTGGSGFDVNVEGADSLVQQCHLVNAGLNGALALAGVGSRADGNRIVGLGSAVGGYGIWAISHQKVFITNNRITGTAIDAIGFDGPGTQVIGNYVAGCACAANGGQIAQYSPGLYPGALIQGNYIDQGSTATLSSGIELHGSNVSVVGNVIINQQGCGINIDGGTGAGILISGNTILNNTHNGSAPAGIGVYGPISDLMIIGNRISDMQATHTQGWGIWLITPPFNNLIITNNEMVGNVSGGLVFVSNGGTGQIIRDNIGAADVPGVPTINAANDAAAATAGVTVGGTYRNGSAIMVRVA